MDLNSELTALNEEDAYLEMDSSLSSISSISEEEDDGENIQSGESRQLSPPFILLLWGEKGDLCQSITLDQIGHDGTDDLCKGTVERRLESLDTITHYIWNKYLPTLKDSLGKNGMNNLWFNFDQNYEEYLEFIEERIKEALIQKNLLEKTRREKLNKRVYHQISKVGYELLMADQKIKTIGEKFIKGSSIIAPNLECHIPHTQYICQ